MHGLELPKHVFDELIDYQEKVKVRYEMMYWQFYENQITLVAKNKKLSFKKDMWVAKANQAKKMIQELKEHKRKKATKYHEEL